MATDSHVHAAVPETSVPLVAGTLAPPTAQQGGMKPSSVGDPVYQTATPWGPWQAIGVVAAVLGLSVLIGLIGAAFIAATLRDTAQVSHSAKMLMVMLAAQFVMIVGPVAAVRLKGGDLSRALALRAPAGGLWSYAAGLVVTLAAVVIYSDLSSRIFGRDSSADLAAVADIFHGPWWPLALFVVGIGAPMSEELLFRGFLQTALAQSRLGYWGSALITTTLWTAMHAGYSPAGLGEVFVIGLVFAYFLKRTGSLRVTLFAHALYNTGIALVMVFAPASLLG